MTQITNLTPNEHFRVYGFIHPSHAEILLDAYDAKMGFSVAHIEEARGCFPEEDFLDRILDKLNDLKSNLRGGNRETLNSIYEELKNLSVKVGQQSEYGVSEIDAFLKDVDNY